MFVEIVPAPALRDIARKSFRAARSLASTLVPDLEEWRPLLETVAALHCRGIAVDWSGFDRDYPRRKVALPLYPFERTRYWPELRQRLHLPSAEQLSRARTGETGCMNRAGRHSLIHMCIRRQMVSTRGQTVMPARTATPR